jgi:hypothetical protein
MHLYLLMLWEPFRARNGSDVTARKRFARNESYESIEY